MAGVMIALALAACGSSSSGGSWAAGAGNSATVQAAYPVRVTAARFPRTQRLAGRTRLVIAVHNTGHRALPDVAVTICRTSCRGGRATDTAAFGRTASGTDLATASRPVWIVNRAPGDCPSSCHSPGGQAGPAVTASSNTWALGRLAPGRTARFSWTLTPVAAGPQVVAWKVAGDLTGAAKATVPGGGVPQGRFAVTIARAPLRSHVTPTGRVVTSPAS